MKTLIAAVTFTAAASAHAMNPAERTLAVQCWPTQAVVKLVENKTLLISRYYPASFLSGEGHMAEFVHAGDRQLLWFAIDKNAACMVAVAAADPDDLKRVGLR
jgi:hypothetical protein